MYAYHALFGEDRRASRGPVLVPGRRARRRSPSTRSTASGADYGIVALNQASSRLFVVPPSLGVEYRMLNGYVYVSANPITDEAELARRAELFARRGGYYYEHWDELYERWVERVEATIAELAVARRCPSSPSSRTRRS